MRYFVVFIAAVYTVFLPFTNVLADSREDIIIENSSLKLIIGHDGTAESLLFKPTNEECLAKDLEVPVFTVTQERPYNNEVKLAHPNKKTTFPADTVHRKGDQLIVGFETIPYEAVVKVREQSGYISFSLEGFIVEEDDYRVRITPPPVFEMCFLQLPVKNRDHFGEWLNVSWDSNIAVNILGTDQYARIDAEKHKGYRIMRADAVNDIKLKGVGAALIVCDTDDLLDNIARVEDDFNLPEGVRSRRDKMINSSYYWSADINPDNLEQHLRYAEMGGFRCMLIYYPSFIEGTGYRKLGNYDWKKSRYPNGKEDLRNVLNKIQEQGITPGFHFLHSHIGRDSKYVTPVPDHRLNLLRYFTLSEPLGETDTEVFIEQNPRGTTMADGCRVLKIGTELISYESYTSAPPYKFTGCSRGIDETTVNSQPRGFIFGLLDVSEFGASSVYIDETTSLQDEIAEKLANIYDAGFRFVYFDGSEGVNSPFWYNVSAAQYKVFRRLEPEPLFAEGAAKTHFSWHMLSGGNAFDVWKPEYIKESIRKFPAEEAPRMREDFTRINFGWLGYWVPDETTVGTQPDMLEYVTSRAAAWDCPLSIQVNLEKFDSHPRTPDNLEVLRRWEEVRVKNWLSPEQKEMLKNLDQEHILLLDEQQQLELVPYEQIEDAADGSKEIRAFMFSRNDNLYVVYWHISGSGRLQLQLDAANVRLCASLGEETPVDSNTDNSITVPVGKRRFLKISGTSKDNVIEAFEKAVILD